MSRFATGVFRVAAPFAAQGDTGVIRPGKPGQHDTPVDLPVHRGFFFYPRSPIMPSPNTRKIARNGRHPHNPVRTADRKDNNVRKSSHGKFRNVSELVAHQREVSGTVNSERYARRMRRIEFHTAQAAKVMQKASADVYAPITETLDAVEQTLES
jgi:hypothetical protein